MSENIITVGDLFALDQEPGREPRPQKDWRTRLGTQLDEELKAVRWPTALPDIAQKISELLNLPFPTVFFKGWKTLEVVQTAMKETSGNPEGERDVDLTNLTMESVWEPAIEVRLWKVMPLPKTLKFPVKLEGEFHTLKLKIKNGAIAGITGCECEVAGTVSLGSTVLAERKFGTITIVGALLDDMPEALAAGVGEGG